MSCPNLPDSAGVYADLGNSPLNSRAGRGSLRESGILMHDLPTRTLEFRDSQKLASKPFLGELCQIHAFTLNSRAHPGVQRLCGDLRRAPAAVRPAWSRHALPQDTSTSERHPGDIRYPKSAGSVPSRPINLSVFRFIPSRDRWNSQHLATERHLMGVLKFSAQTAYHASRNRWDSAALTEPVVQAAMPIAQGL